MSKNKRTITPQTGNARMLAIFLRGSKMFFFIGMISAAVTALADMIIPQIIRVTVDNILPNSALEEGSAAKFLTDAAGGLEHLAKNLWIPATAVVVVSLFKVVSQYTFRVFNTKGSETLVKTMRDSLFEHIEKLPFSWHMQNKTGDIIQRCTSDIDTMRNFVSEQLTSVLRIVIMLVLSMVFMFSMNPLLTVVSLVPMPVIIGYSFLFHRKIGAGFLECDENEGKLSAMAQENLTGVRVVRAFGREKYECDRFEKQNETYTTLWEHLARVMSRFWSSADILSGLQVMLVVVFGAFFCTRGMMLPGEYIAFISYNSMLVWPVRMLGRMISEMSKAGVSTERIRQIMTAPVEEDKPDAVCPDMHADIAFEHVDFAYDGHPQMLKDVSFTVEKGTTLGILGGTGSGKTTLMMLLDKLYDLPDACGKITVGGVDIRNIKTEYLRKNIGMVLQEPYLFSRTLAENIGITRKDISMDEIREAASAACLDDTIMNFTQGYETFVGERGVTLSGGQKQRAAIARMLTQKTPIMVFDDSLSAVDTQTDVKIRKALEEMFGSSSVILISHRITTLMKADKIIVLDKGRIVEQGTHDELKTAGGIYQKIYESQSLSEEEAANI